MATLPINIIVYTYSNGVAGTAFIKALTYLVRPGVDAMDSTADVNTSDNAAVAVSGTAKIPQKISLKLTDIDGKINGRAVNGGDLLRIEMQRGTDTATDDILVFNTSEVSIV